MSPEEIATMTALTSFAAVIATLFSAIAAWRAVNVAKSASRSSEMTERRILAREIGNGCREVIGIATRVQDLATNLLALNKDLAIFAGQLGSSRQQLFANEIEYERKKIASVVQSISGLFASEAALHQMETDQLNEIYGSMSIQMAEATSVREELEAKMASLSAQVKSYRENAINT